LRSEHVARVHDFGTLENGAPYLVMDYLEGTDLATLLKARGTLTVEEIADTILQACDAVGEAHAHGIIHRDLKPGNLFIERGLDGAPLVKVLDFGISKTNPFGEKDHDITRTASMLGSPRFMSPEQMRDPRGVDARSDIWSLGVVLYRLCGGKPPFEADTLGRLLTMVMHEHPEMLGAIVADLPPGFEAVVMRCLAKDPAQRYSNVADLAYALAPFAIDPVRGRAAADKIAAMLTLNPSARSGHIPIAINTGRPSAPPHIADTGGTAAPWAGTQSTAQAMPPPSRNAIVWASVAMATLVVAGALFVKVRYDRALAAESAQQAATSTGAIAPPTEAPTETPAVAVPPPPATFALPPPTVIAPATSTAPSPQAKPIETTKRATAPSPQRPAKPSRPSSPTDGIPATRD
ncbi:MAG TPA: protein kinase, partial [Labilithrix sp.]